MPTGKQFVGCGAKSGIYYCLDPDTGKVVWKTQVGPGGTGGGIEWGSATDGNRIYSAISNSSDLVVPQFGATFTGGLWAGIDAKTGRVLWQTADPLGGHDYGMVTHANGVVYAASAGNPINRAYPIGSPGGFFAMDANTGKILWQFTIANDPAMGSSICGPSVVDGTVYWGSGYSHLFNAFGISGLAPKLYAFSVD